MNQELIAKEYGFSSTETKNTDLVSVSENRAMHEVQAAYVIAKKFPRNESESFSKIMNACKRPFLAEQAMYVYPKGGKSVSGASIRLAEVILSYWGNCESGVREISQSNGVSICEAYAIDLETNTRDIKIFHVPHHIHTKNGMKKITDPREIYELIANMGARRKRACILSVLPGDIVEAALEECKKTMMSGKEPIADRVRKLVLAFDELGVKVEHLEKRLGHNLDSTVEQELVTLRGIYKSIKDGLASRESFFEMGLASTANQSIDELISSKKQISNTDDSEYSLKEFNKNTGEIIDKDKKSAKEAINKIKEQLNIQK